MEIRKILSLAATTVDADRAAAEAKARDYFTNLEVLVQPGPAGG